MEESIQYSAGEIRKTLRLTFESGGPLKYNTGYTVKRTDCRIARDDKTRGGFVELIVARISDYPTADDLVVGLFQAAGKRAFVEITGPAILKEYSSSGAGTAILAALKEGAVVQTKSYRRTVIGGVLTDTRDADLRAAATPL